MAPHPIRLADVDPELLARARRRLGLKKGFAIHALVFVGVNGGLLLLNALAGGRPWSVWPLSGWGLGLALHGLVTALALQEGLRQRWLAAEVARLRGGA